MSEQVEKSLNWIERRHKAENLRWGLWDGFCLDLRGLVDRFDKLYAFRQGLEAKGYPRDGCFHIALTPLRPSEANHPQPRSIDVCLEDWAIAAESNGKLGGLLRIAVNDLGEPYIANPEDQEPLSNDLASQFLLEGFLFPDKAKS